MHKKLNIIINGFSGEHNKAILFHTLPQFPLGNISVIAAEDRDVPYELPAEKIIWEYPPHMWKCDWENIHPIDEELIEQMRPYEAVFLHIMEREQTRGKVISYSERKLRYLRLLQYWNHVIEERGVNLLLSTSLPHRNRTYLIFSLCRAKGIPTLFFFYSSPLEQEFTVVEHWENFSPEIEKKCQELYASFTDEEALKIPLSDKYEKFFQEQVSQKKDPPLPYYMLENLPTPLSYERSRALKRGLKDISSFLLLIHSTIRSRCSFQYWSRLIRHQRRLRNAKKMFAFYDHHATVPDLFQRFVYVPLHNQPECSTCPMSGAYTDQILVVHMLHALLPDDILLYVKEHPNQQKNFPDGMCRDISLYQDLLKFSRVRLVPRSFSTHQLTKASVAVATGTGMSGFEALFRDTPVLLFGRWTQEYAKGVFPIRTVDDCKKALHSILHEGIVPSLPKTRLFLRALQDCSFEGSIEHRFGDQASRYVESFSSALEKKIFSLFPQYAREENVASHQ